VNKENNLSVTATGLNQMNNALPALPLRPFQIAILIDKSRMTAWRLLTSGKIPSHLINGRERRAYLHDVESYLLQNRHA